MNIVFALYNDLTCNSASHVDGVARELANRGCDCVVALPSRIAGVERFDPPPYRVTTFDRFLENPRMFADRRGPDILHCWTPREINRRFHERLASRNTYRLVVHLEDNEEHICRCSIGDRAYRKAEEGRIEHGFPEHLSHPTRYRRFLAEAAGASLLIESLAEFVPDGTPRTVFWPAADPRVFYVRPRNIELRAKHRIPASTCVFTYHGNTHVANAREIRSLYLAVALLNREGVPAKLVRLGVDYSSPSNEQREWCKSLSIELGYIVDREAVSDALAMADILVQPGSSDPFNDYRFPSKLPEFFAMGRPVILPRTNIGLVTRHLEDAYVLERGDGPSIADAVRDIRSRPGLESRLSDGAELFAKRQFSWNASAGKLLDFYRRLVRADRIRLAA